MKRLVIVIVASLGILVGCSQKSENVLTVGMECNYAPYNWTTTEDKASEYAQLISGSNVAYCDGYDVAIASLLAEDLGYELEIKQLPWDGLIPALQANEIDLIIAGMSPTAERKQTINFSDAYFRESSNMGIIVKSDSDLVNAKSLDDFSGKIINAQMGTFHVDLLDQIPEVAKTAALDSFPALIQATKSDAIDGYISEDQVAYGQIAENKDLAFVEFEEGKGFELADDQTTTAIGVKIGDEELLTKVNESLSKISEEQRDQLMSEANSASGEGE